MDDRFRPSTLHHCLQTSEKDFLSSGWVTRLRIKATSASPSQETELLLDFFVRRAILYWSISWCLSRVYFSSYLCVKFYGPLLGLGQAGYIFSYGLSFLGNNIRDKKWFSKSHGIKKLDNNKIKDKQLESTNTFRVQRRIERSNLDFFFKNNVFSKLWYVRSSTEKHNLEVLKLILGRDLPSSCYGRGKARQPRLASGKNILPRGDRSWELTMGTYACHCQFATSCEH